MRLSLIRNGWVKEIAMFDKIKEKRAKKRIGKKLQELKRLQEKIDCMCVEEEKHLDALEKQADAVLKELTD